MALPEWCCTEPVPTYICVNICTQLTKGYVTKTSCNQLFLIESATCMLKIDLPVVNKVAMSLHDVIVQRPSTVEAVNCHQSKTACHWIRFGRVVYTAARPGGVTSQRLKGLRSVHRITLLWQMQKTRDLPTLVLMCGCALSVVLLTLAVVLPHHTTIQPPPSVNG